jgi:hypothetical protein
MGLKGIAVLETASALRAILNDAYLALHDGEAIQAERRAKAVSALVRAERDVAEFLNQARAAAMENDDEACRAELRRRFALVAEAERAGAPDEVLARIAREGVAG